MNPECEMSIRSSVRPADESAVYDIVSSSGFFTDWEVDIATSLVREKLEQGEACSYEFLFAEVAGSVVGYACYGASDEDPSLYDLYWIGVQEEFRGQHIGRALLDLAEDMIRFAGGQTVRIETSARQQYAPTRAFYEGRGYVVEREDSDFYAPGESRLTYTREVGASLEAANGYDYWEEYSG